jgi:hypothetical protein
MKQFSLASKAKPREQPFRALKTPLVTRQMILQMTNHSVAGREPTVEFGLTGIRELGQLCTRRIWQFDRGSFLKHALTVFASVSSVPLHAQLYYDTWTHSPTASAGLQVQTGQRLPPPQTYATVASHRLPGLTK